MNTYISAQGERHSVKIKGLDDKGGQEEWWICNGFIAVVKILKVSKKSTLTHAVKKKKYLKQKKCWKAFSLEIPKRRGRGWALVYLPERDKSISCLTEWASFTSSTTKAFWTKVFFKVQVFRSVSFVIRVQLNLCFHFDVAICAGHLNLHCLCFNRNPEDMSGLSFCELGIRSVGMMQSPLSKGNRQECLVGNCTGAMSAYLTVSLVRQRCYWIISGHLQFLQKGKPSEIEILLAEIKLLTD